MKIKYLIIGCLVLVAALALVACQPAPAPAPATREELERVLKEFSGDVWQTPPMFSAKKWRARKLTN